ncbi:MAG: class I SAM-dependent methyltransferase [Gemmatimonadota bacterium]
MHLTFRSTCRACGSSALTPVLDLGPQYLQGSFVMEGKPLPPMRRIPTALVRCDPSRDEKACGLVQMVCSVPPEILYSVYWYRSGTNETMRRHLASVVSDAMSTLGRTPLRVLDIGCNDGTLLRNYPAEVVQFGCDPSDAVLGCEPTVHVVQETFPSRTLQRAAGEQPFDIVTSIAMFYDLEDPVDFVRNIKALLAPGGVWIFEVAYLPLTLELNSYDTICHEHLEYYSLAVIERIVAAGGMKVRRAALNSINGGSIRVFVTHEEDHPVGDDTFRRELTDLRHREFERELETDLPYELFKARVSNAVRSLTSLVTHLRDQGKTIHIYGASTKGNTILQACGLDKSHIAYAADRNPDKDGARTLGTNIPIISEERSRAMKPDYYLVLPWHFRTEFLKREQPMIDAGTGMIFPLPVVELITKDGSHSWDPLTSRLARNI